GHPASLPVAVAGANLEAGGFHAQHASAQASLGAARPGCPTASLEHGKAARLPARRRRVRSLQPGGSGIAADTGDDFASHLPGILQRCGENAGAALTLIVVAALAVDGVDARLETDATAEARRGNDGADDLRAERGPDANRGRR